MNDSVSADAQASGPGASTQVPAGAQAGALLREAREAQGLQAGALAVALKVPVRQIEALEADRMDLLPDMVFARGLAASICRQLKIDPQPVLARLPQGTPRLSKDREPINEPFRTPGQSSGLAWREQLGRPPVLVALLLLLGAVLLLVLPLFQGMQGTARPAASATVLVPLPAASSAPVLAQPGVVTENVTPALPAAPVASGMQPLVPALPAGPAASR